MAGGLERYEVSRDMVVGIDSLTWTGGGQVQLVVAPDWGGDDERFDLTVDSAKDLHLLPALQKVSGLFDMAKKVAVVEAFAAHGVALRHPYG